jgi:hypothetical protein
MGHNSQTPTVVAALATDIYGGFAQHTHRQPQILQWLPCRFYKRNVNIRYTEKLIYEIIKL